MKADKEIKKLASTKPDKTGIKTDAEKKEKVSPEIGQDPGAAARLKSIQFRRSRNRAVILFFAMLFISLISFSIVSIINNRSLSNPVPAFLNENILEESYEAKGIVVRDEALFAAGKKGLIDPVFPEGDKVSKGELAAFVLDEKMRGLYTERAQLLRDIANRRLELIGQGVYRSDGRKYKISSPALESELNQLRKMFINLSASGADAIQGSIDSLVDERNKELENLNFQDEKLSEMTARVSEINKTFAGSSDKLLTNYAGYISFESDGRESILNSSKLSALNQDHVLQVLREGETYKKIEESANPKDAAYRLIKGGKQSFVLLVEGMKADRLEKGDTVTLLTHGINDEIPACKVLSSEKTPQGTLVRLESFGGMKELMRKRIFSGRILVDRNYGYRIPVHALMNIRKINVDTNEIEAEINPEAEENSESEAEYIDAGDMMLVIGGSTKIVTVEISYMGDRYALINDMGKDKYLEEGTVYIDNPERVKEGTIIE